MPIVAIQILMAEGTSLEKTELIVNTARSWVGTPYHHQASLKGVGVDCIGLVRGVYRELYGVEPPELLNYSADWGDSNGNEEIVLAAYRYLEPVPLDALQPGDVILVRWAKHRVAKHCMILTHDGRAVHAYNRAPVTEIHLSDWWRQRIVYAFRFPKEVK